MIDKNWRPKDWGGKAFKGPSDVVVEYLLNALNQGDVPPGLEDIPAVVEAVKAKHHLVELAEDQTPLIERCTEHSIKKEIVPDCPGCERELAQAGYAIHAELLKEDAEIVRETMIKETTVYRSTYLVFTCPYDDCRTTIYLDVEDDPAHGRIGPDGDLRKCRKCGKTTRVRVVESW